MTSVVSRGGAAIRRSNSSSARAAASLSRFGIRTVSACKSTTTRRGDHHRQRPHGGDEARHSPGQAIPARPVAGVNALDVERAQPVLDQLLEVMRQRRLLDIVLAKQQVDGIGRAGLDLLEDGGRSEAIRTDLRIYEL